MDFRYSYVKLPVFTRKRKKNLPGSRALLGTLSLKWEIISRNVKQVAGTFLEGRGRKGREEERKERKERGEKRGGEGQGGKARGREEKEEEGKAQILSLLIDTSNVRNSQEWSKLKLGTW